MSDDDFEEHNVERKPKEPPHVTAIRDAIKSLLPEDENIVSDTKIHDGVVDVSIRWKSLRWSVSESIAGREADDIALKLDGDFRAWLRNVIKNMANVPKHSRVAADMKRWLKENPDRQEWLYGKKEVPADAG